MASATIRLHLIGRFPEGPRSTIQFELDREPGLTAVVTEGECDVVPDLVIASVTHPDEMSPARLESLIHRWPGARFLLLGGPWCESIIRNRRLEVVAPWTTMEDFRSRLRMEFEAFTGRGRPLAITADRVEQFELEGLFREGSAGSTATSSTRPVLFDGEE